MSRMRGKEVPDDEFLEGLLASSLGSLMTKEVERVNVLRFGETVIGDWEMRSSSSSVVSLCYGVFFV